MNDELNRNIDVTSADHKAYLLEEGNVSKATLFDTMSIHLLIFWFMVLSS